MQGKRKAGRELWSGKVVQNGPAKKRNIRVIEIPSDELETKAFGVKVQCLLQCLRVAGLERNRHHFAVPSRREKFSIRKRVDSMGLG